MDWASRLAMVFRIWERGTSWYAPAAATGAALVGAGALSRSRRTILPSGPEPARAPRSSPRSLATFRARGEALVRPPALAAGGATAVLACGATTAWAAGLRGCTAVEAGVGAAGAGALPVRALMSSPGWPMTPTSFATATVLPAGTSCLSSTPSARATSSMTALSVSTSAMTSPGRTASPSCFFHSTSRPSSIVGDRASIRTFDAMRPIPGGRVRA